MARRPHRGFTQGVRRATQWLASTAENGLTSLNANTSVMDQTFAFGEDGTVIRTRGTLFMKSD